MRNRRKLSYAVIHYDYTHIKRNVMTVTMTSHKIFHTFKKAERYARKIGGSAFIEKCYLSGKYKGLCQYIYLRGLK